MEDGEVIKVIQKLAKQRKDSIEQYTAGGGGGGCVTAGARAAPARDAGACPADPPVVASVQADAPTWRTRSRRSSRCWSRTCPPACRRRSWSSW